MGEMFAWYIDNSKYFTENFSRMIINYSVEATKGNVNITDVVDKYSPDKGNKSANITAARDFGIINNDSLLSDGAVLFNSGFYEYSDFVLDQISKRNVAKSKNIPLKPLVIIAKVFDKMWSIGVDSKDVFLTTDECYRYLSVIDTYNEITEDKVRKIIDNRIYKKGSTIPERAMSGANIGVYLSELFTALADSKLFDLGLQKSILRPVELYCECISYIAYYGENISLAPTVKGRDNEGLYNYLCDIETGIKEIIPEVKFKQIPDKKQIKNLYLYIFGINRLSFEWNKYFEEDCFGIYRIFFPIKRIVFAKLYKNNKKMAEYLCDYAIQSQSYVEMRKGGKLMITEPFESGHTPLSELNNDRKLNYITNIKEGVSRNLIVFGAPGTGKSFELNSQRENLLGQEDIDNFERVTFHPDYSYANFVGTYKPIMINKNSKALDEEGKEEIAYEYVPGPFMRVLAEALKNAMTDNPKPYLLIIEEINRANVAAVFGDVFQLLDRASTNDSEYEITTTNEMRTYLAKELGVDKSAVNTIKIPDNMFLWATMNSADQGVFPMDTAFKRRWDFTYLGIDDSEEDLVGKTVLLGAGNTRQKVEWNKLRKAINNFLAKEKINEDKQLGPYFIARNIVVPEEGTEIDNGKFIHTFKSKVIMYLFEDAAKQKRSKLFEGCFENSSRYSKICKEFEKKGIGIFHHDIQIETEPEDLINAFPGVDE